MVFWYFRISCRAFVPGLYLLFFLGAPEVDSVACRADVVAPLARDVCPPLEEKSWKELSSETRHICQSEREQNDSGREGSGQEAERRCREARPGEREVLVSVPGKTRARAIDSKLGLHTQNVEGATRERGDGVAPTTSPRATSFAALPPLVLSRASSSP